MMNRTQENEGGYSNHPNDRGGETRYGISSRWYPDEDIANLTRERANAILYRDYWLKPHINKLPDEFADIVFDDGVVQGQPTAIKNLQRALGTHADGIIGPNTLSAFENANYNTVRRNFIRNVNNVEDEYLRNDPSQRVFEKGHRDRFNKY
jgi:lysozyme family protein